MAGHRLLLLPAFWIPGNTSVNFKIKCRTIECIICIYLCNYLLYLLYLCIFVRFFTLWYYIVELLIMFRYDGIVDLSSAECYDPNCNRWSAVTSLGTKRSCLGISANHGLLYVCGGFDGASCLSSVERYDPLTGVWSSCPSMTTRRRYCRVSVVGKTNRLRMLRCIWYYFSKDDYAVLLHPAKF